MNVHMALSQVDNTMEKDQLDPIDQTITEKKGELEDLSLITATEEKALVRKIDRK